MSEPLFKNDVLFFQRLLKCEGLYKKKLDGDRGRFTEAAARRFYDKSYAIADEVGALDSWSEGSVRTLALAAQREARLFLQRVLNAGLNARIISGTRTYA